MATWGYGKCCGPETWSKQYPNASGDHQSPIDIDTKHAVFDSGLRNIKIVIDKEISKNQTLHFHGHYFKVEAPNDSMTIDNGPASNIGTFKFVQLHFHWGKSEKDNGSEHTVDGHGFPSELHMVHYNSSKYADCGEAVNHKDGLLVLGIIIKIGEKNTELEKLMKPLTNIKTEHEMHLHENLDFRGILPKNTEDYFTYPGSLTTPPCNECVTWVVFKEQITMSAEQLVHFQKMHSGDGCETSENFRPVCPLNKRGVKKSFQ